MQKPTRTVTSPKKFIIGSDLLSEIDEYVRAYGDHAFFICDEFILERTREQAGAALAQAKVGASYERFGGECTQTEIDRQLARFKASGANVIVGIGGGKTLDTAKAVAFYAARPVLIFPTIASTDAPCTALAVIYKEGGEFDRYLWLPQNPDVVLADTGILVAAPFRFFAAGVGDALATYFEARACYLSDGVNLVNKKPSRTGLGLAELCYQLLRENVAMAADAVRAKAATPAFEHIIEATIYLSGVGAEAGGLAAAHAVNNGMSAIPQLHNAQHGEKVGFGLLTQLVLEGAPEEEFAEVIRIMKTVGLPLSLDEFGLTAFIEADWRRVAEIACAEGDSMANMLRRCTPDQVYDAMRAADAIGKRYA
ncbi:glycerol dehydrogenase [Paludibacterium yongneupense]|uniref:glycerol dehydrogenase n=1 Tax=Paludibacterium yongneupense TaxID=400061 RepID=UPI0003FF827F|nr:glycerol dehydrogenase [Paludibacterium yongneupense]